MNNIKFIEQLKGREESSNKLLAWIKTIYKGRLEHEITEDWDSDTEVYFKSGGFYYGAIRKDLLLQKSKEFGLSETCRSLDNSDIFTDAERKTILSMSCYWDEVAQRDDKSPLQAELSMVARRFGSKVLFALAEYVRNEHNRQVLRPEQKKIISDVLQDLREGN